VSSSSPDAWWIRRPSPTAVADDVPQVVAPPVEPAPMAATIALPPEAPEAEEAEQAQEAEQAAPEQAPQPARSRRLTPRRAVLGAGAVAVVVAAGVLGWVDARRDDATPAAAGTATVVAPVDPGTITAVASSTQQAQGPVGYGAGNTLDGDPATAWNSDGPLAGKSAGIALTYTFAQAVDLRSVVVRNGYQKLRQRAGRSAVDLYPANARARRVRVVTDAGTWTWDLADVRAAQTFNGAAGRTRSVRLEIVSAYSSTTYPDIALSEVGFTAAVLG
jgi:outer membrane biosynthesis protein TonB